MLFHLIKKDFLIVKKYVLIVLVAAILIPPVMRWRTPEFAGTFGFILSVIFSVFWNKFLKNPPIHISPYK